MNPEIVKKILQYAPEPPAKVWDGISKILDENLPGDLADRLQNFETLPPAGTWNKIEDKLASSPAQNSKTKFFTFSRMASAAAVILIATASIIYWYRDPETPGAVSSDPSVTIHTQNQPAPVIPNSTRDTEEVNKDEDLLAIVDQPAKKEDKNMAVSRPRPAKQNHVHYAANSYVAHSFIPAQAEQKAVAVSSYPLDKYMVYSDDDGNAMRLSKKLVELISCVKEEVVCAEQVQQMQYKIANYLTTNDFSGLMEMLRNMKENK